MNYNNILICVDQSCYFTNKIIDNWETLLKHQQMSHAILTLNQFYESLQKNQEFQNLEEFYYCLEDDMKEHQRFIDYMCSDFKEECKMSLDLFFEKINENFVHKFRNDVLQRVKELHLPLDNFQAIIYNNEYQQKALLNFSEFKAKNFIQDFAQQICILLESQFKNFLNDLNNFYQYHQQNFDSNQEFKYQSGNLTQNFSLNINFDDIKNFNNFYQEENTTNIDLPLKNYKNTLNQNNFQSNTSFEQNNQSATKVNVSQSSQAKSDAKSDNSAIKTPLDQQPNITKISETKVTQNLTNVQQSQTSTRQIQNQKPLKQAETVKPQKEKQQPTKSKAKSSAEIQYVQKRSNQEKQKEEYNYDSFSKPNFQLLNKKVSQFSSKHMYGDLDIIENDKSITTDDEGLILLEGFINKNQDTNFVLKINKIHSKYEVEIGVIDWDTFRFPKLNKAQAGVYSYNNFGEIFDNGVMKIRKENFFSDKSQITITYQSNSCCLIFNKLSSGQNQSICLKGAHKSQLTFFVNIYKAKITLV